MKKSLYMISGKIKNIINFIISLLISVFLIIYAIRNYNYNSFIIMLDNIQYYKIFFAMLVLVFSVYIRSLRWQILIKEDIPLNFLYESELVGYFGNNVLPLRGGEFLRTYLVSEKFHIPKSKIFGSIILERILDMLGVSIFLFILMFINFNFLFKINISLMYSIIAIVVLGILGTILSYVKNIPKLKIEKSKFIFNINGIFMGFSNLNKGNILNIFITTFLIWSLYLLQLYLVQSSFNLNLTIEQMITLLVISTVALSIPALPGNFGTFEGAVIYSLSLFNIQDNFGFGLILHAVSFIPYTLLGLMYFVKNFSWFKKINLKLLFNDE